MYTGPVAAVPVTAGTVAAVTTLPNTGGNLLITAAVSVAAGLVAWGVMYAYSR